MLSTMRGTDHVLAMLVATGTSVTSYSLGCTTRDCTIVDSVELN
jgi:hypothetical protein